MEEKDITWLAGLLEGEGCFSYYISPGIVVGMTDKDVIERVAKLLERHVRGPYKYKGNKKAVYYTELWADKAIEVMKLILPYMGKRRTKKIIEIIKKREQAPGKGHKLGTGLKPKCHPDKEHYAFEMCRSCYRKDKWKKGLPR